jgi:hypothetical protein
MAQKSSTNLIPAAKDLAALPDGTALKALEVIDRASERRHSYAMRGMLCGTVGLVSSVGAFAFLVHDGHPREAFALLGVNVIGLLLQMIKSRLES